MKLPEQVRWYWVTRFLAAMVILYEIPFDHSTDRGTIVLASMGLLGFDWVSREAKKKRDEQDDSNKD